MPENKDGKRTANGWEFFYDGSWKRSDVEGVEPARDGAAPDDPLPESLKGSLDADALKLLGMDRSRIIDKDGVPDSLFFYQLLKPIQNPPVICKRCAVRVTCWHQTRVC